MGKVGAMMLDQAAKLSTIEGIHRLSLSDLNEESDLEMTWNSLHTVKDEIRKRSRRRRKLLSILGQRVEDVPLDQEQASFIGQHFSPHTATWPVHVVRTSSGTFPGREFKMQS
jgi:hypothetical protein